METVSEMRERLLAENVAAQEQRVRDNLRVWEYVQAVQAENITLYEGDRRERRDAVRVASEQTRDEVIRRAKNVVHPPETEGNTVFLGFLEVHFIALACNDCKTALCIQNHGGMYVVHSNTSVSACCVGCGRHYNIPENACVPTRVHRNMIEGYIV